MNSIRILFSIVVNLSWPLLQLDVKNAFIYGDLQEKVYMEQPLGYVAQGETKVRCLKKAIYGLKQSPRVWFEKFSLTISGIDFRRWHLDHSVFVWRTRSGIVALTVYVDDIFLTESDSTGIVETKLYLKRHFVTKNMWCPKYFLRIEVAYQKHSVLLSQKKYALDLLKEIWFLRCKPSNTPMKANVNLWFDDIHTLDDPGRYRRLIGKLIYLTVTRPDITFIVGVLSRYMYQLRETYWLAVMRVLTYIKSYPGKGLMYKNIDMHTFLDTLIQGILVMKGIGSLLLAIAPLLEEIWWLGGARNKTLYLAQVLKLSIELWLIQHARLCG